MFDFRISVIFFVKIVFVDSFTVDILNITRCRSSQFELADLQVNIGPGRNVDPLLTGILRLPVNLDENTYFIFETYAWSGSGWKFLFNGKKSFCNSVVNSIPYKTFSRRIVPTWPRQCNIPSGNYRLVKFPVSGQYVALSGIRNVSPILRHKVKLMNRNQLLLCRIIYTKSNN